MMTRRQAAELFAKYGNVGSAEEMLRIPPTMSQLASAIERVRWSGRVSDSDVSEAAILMMRAQPEAEEAQKIDARKDQATRLGNAIEEALPVFGPFTPAGWKDFRDDSALWRGGIFFKDGNASLSFCGPIDRDASSFAEARWQFRAAFGSEVVAHFARVALIPYMHDARIAVSNVEPRLWWVDWSVLGAQLEEFTAAFQAMRITPKGETK